MMQDIIKIRPEQMFVFEQESQGHMAAEILEYLRENVPESVAALPSDEALLRVRFALRRAEEFGLGPGYYGACVIWVRLMFTAGPYFDRHPACAAILTARSAPPEMRVEALIQTRNRVPWDEVAADCGNEEWK
jgi:acetyl esterase/lipase